MTITTNVFARLGQIFALLFLAAFIFTACSKDKTESNPSLAGMWEGSWGDVGQTPTNFIKFEFKNDGTLTRLDQQGQVIANGTWSINGVEFSCTYTHTADGQVHKIGGLYTDFDGVITGTWGYSPSQSNGGTIELEKQ